MLSRFRRINPRSSRCPSLDIQEDGCWESLLTTLIQLCQMPRDPYTIKRYTAPHNCDSVEVNPSKSRAFVGMYEYEESSASRGGGFLIMSSEGELVHNHSTPNYGCLDAKWISDSDIAFACSDGLIRTYSTFSNSVSSEVPVVPHPSPTNTANILMTIDVVKETTAVITAKGELILVKEGQVVTRWEAHSPIIESWTCALRPDANLVATGSDDCSLRFWDTRSQELVLSNTKSHRMGTTCIEFLGESEVLSGSYDDRIRKFDLRNLSEPILEFKSIGGIWRLKPTESNHLMVAACYGGCQVVDLTDFSPVVSRYVEHESMAYGIDSISADTGVSCSFYDKQILYWKY